MADNYLERKMEEYRRGKTAAPRRRIIPSGAVRPQVTVPLGDVTVLVAGADEPLVTAFANAGAAVRFCNAAGDDAAPLSAGRRLAERTGARYLSFSEAEALAMLGDNAVDYVARRSDGGIELLSAATDIVRLVTLDCVAASDKNAAAALETLAVLFCTPLFSTAAATVITIRS